jgi:acetyltransferase-like isoleucine patch superfamily enzyme
VNTITRSWLNWKHGRKFARVGRGSTFPIPHMTVDGHVEIGERCRFRNNATFRTHGDGRIVFGARSGCSWGVLIEAASLVEIGTYTAIAEYSVVSDICLELWNNGDHWRDAKRAGRPIRIGDNCFIGSGCYVGPGVTIGEGAVVATHSIVTRDIGPYEIWSGAPARYVGHRTKDIPEARLREYQELIARHGIKPDRYKD